MKESPVRSTIPVGLIGVISAVSAAIVLLLTLGVRPAAVSVLPEARAEELPASSYASALDVQEAFRTVSAEILPSMVEITVKTETAVEDESPQELPWNDFFSDPSEPSEDSYNPKFYRSHGLGSGVIVERAGSAYYAVTNAHVVGEAEEITLELHDGQKVNSELVGRDERKDLAVLRFTAPEDSFLRVARLGNSNHLYVGDWVLAFGSPYGYEQSVSSGIVSAMGRRDGPDGNINDFIQTDASINQGNSGGALVNIRGEVVGINTFITTPNSGSVGLGFAIPVNNLKTTLRQLIDSGEVQYGWLGLSLGIMSRETAADLGYEPNQGALVYQVFEGAPADEAGFRAGDLILSLNGESEDVGESILYRVGDLPPGEEALFSVDRFGLRMDIKALIGVREGEEAVRAMHGQARPGFVPAPLTSDLREMMKLTDEIRGVAVAEVFPRTMAQAVDLRSGDLILAVNGVKIDSLRSLYIALGPTSYPSFTVYRNGQEIELRRNQEGQYE